MLEKAKQLDDEAGVVVRYVTATAERTGLSDTSFEVVTAGQCWHWFDRLRAAQEVRRVLVPRGWLVIAHFDWISLPENVVEATEKLVEQHNPQWKLGSGRGMYPAWLRDVAIAGFQDIETFSFDVYVPYSHEAWRGQIRASMGVAASLTPEQVACFDEDLQKLLQKRFSAEPLLTHHHVFTVICRVL